MLSLHQVHSYYGESHILQGVSLEVPPASLVALLGRNGMGKTTTIHNIIGFHQPSQGQIIYKNINISGLGAYKITRMGMAIIPQGRRIFPSLTVKENLLLASPDASISYLNCELNKIYTQFPVLKERSRHRGDQLSGGEQQLLAIARALIRKPDLILMDEPFEGLAPFLAKSIQQTIVELKASGLTFLLVEHDLQLAISIADYVYIMNNGRIVYEGTADQLQAKREIIKKYLAL